jgi:hypothetical protein
MTTATATFLLRFHYKIIGQPRKIYRWSRGPAQAGLIKGDYSPQQIFTY